MRNITVTLVTNKQNEIKRFIDMFYNKNSEITKTTFRWNCICKNLIDTLDILAALMDNKEKYDIECFVGLNRDTTIKITPKNFEIYVRYVIYQDATKNRPIADFYTFKKHIKIPSFFLLSLN